MTHRQELTELQYSDERTGPFKLYLYNRDGFHSGAQWFEDQPKYPEEEITTFEAFTKATDAVARGYEVRVTDGGDFLVFHADDGKVLYPAGGDFWKEIGIVI